VPVNKNTIKLLFRPQTS